MLHVALESLKLAEGESIVCCSDHWRVVGVVLYGSSVLGESASPFIDEGDGLTREKSVREREYVCAT